MRNKLLFFIKRGLRNLPQENAKGAKASGQIHHIEASLPKWQVGDSSYSQPEGLADSSQGSESAQTPGQTHLNFTCKFTPKIEWEWQVGRAVPSAPPLDRTPSGALGTARPTLRSRRAGRLANICLSLFLAAGGFLLAGCNQTGSDQAIAKKAAKYHCPMHPTYVSNRQGDCPICNMKLVPIKEDQPKAKAAAKAKYHCPMHPTYVSDKPGECPICHMDLVPIKNDKAAAPVATETNEENHEAKHEGEHTAAAESPAVPGRVAVMISPEKQQLIGLRTATVESRDLTNIIRTSGTFEHDERRLARIAPRFGGYIRDLKVNYTGQPVEKGEPLLTVYSPELISAENEYLLALQRLKSLKAGAPDHEAAQRLLDSARRRLSLWQIGEEELRELERTGQPKDELLLRSPVSGHVITKMAVEGKAFMAGETLYEIGDLHHLWLRAYVYEYELPLIKVGQKARVILPNQGNQSYESEITFIYPHLDPQTRRAEIRLELDNPGHRLRPQMWANVEINASFGETLTIPASAVIDTGARFVAFVKNEDNHLEPREVKIGVQTDDYYQVLEGVKEGEEVVTRALFLVDSESQLKAAIAGMGAAGRHEH